MRYYYEADRQKERRSAKENLFEIPSKKQRDSLIVEEDTIYEIDEVCMTQRKGLSRSN